MGTQWHQDALSFLVEMLRDVAERRGATWDVCNTIALQGLEHEDGTDYDPRPDVMVLARPLRSGGLSSIHIEEAGAPLFVAEVASRSTAGNDQGDKRHAYEAIGVPEYLVFDPDGDLIPSVIRAWRLEGGVYVPWLAEPDGWWRSASLDVALEAPRPFLGVRDRDGRRILLPSAVRERAERAEQRLDDTEQRLGEAEQRLAREARRRIELEEELRRLRAQRDVSDEQGVDE